MDAGPFFVLSAWAPLPVTKADRTQQRQSTPAAGKAVDTQPQQIPTKPLVARHSRAARMLGPGPELVPTDPAKGAIDCPRSEAKAESGSDEAPLDVGSRSGLAGRASAARRAPGSASSSPPTGSSAQPELPTVAEVLRMAKMLLQPTHVVERQFYADCYRACQVMPITASSRGAAAGGAEGAAGSAGSGGAPPPPPPLQLPYLSSVPEVALRLSCLGHRVVVRRVTDSRQYWSRSMTNLFCYCVLPGTGIGYVLDPGFKEHFRAGRMSDRYRDIWECLPPLFVGPPAKLVQLIQVLCAELQTSFESAHRQLPPWRTFSCTINRWMSPVFRDLPVPLRRTVPVQVPPAATAAAAASGGGGGTTGMIAAADAQAFLRACDVLLAGTASARPGGSRVAASSVVTGGSSSSSSTASGYGAAGSRAIAAGSTATTAVAASARGPGTGSASTSSGSGGGGGSHGGASSGGGTAAPCGGDAARPTVYDGGDGGAAAVRAEVPGRAFAASTAATATASSTAWGPPPSITINRRPLRTVSGFELRQDAPGHQGAMARSQQQTPVPAPEAAASELPLTVSGTPAAARIMGAAVVESTAPVGSIAAAAAPAAVVAARATAAVVSSAGPSSSAAAAGSGRGDWQPAAPVVAGRNGAGLLSRCLRSPALTEMDTRQQHQQQQLPPQQQQR